MAKILFIQKMWYESLSVMQLSAMVKQGGHESYLYMDDGNTDELVSFVKKNNPDLVGFSLMTGQHHSGLRTAELIRKNSNNNRPLIIFGGPHPTFAPEIIEKDPVDIICRGEGEGAILDLMNAIDSGNDFSTVPNLWIKKNGKIIKNEMRPLIEDLDVLPFLDREIFYRYRYFHDSPNKMVMTSRGCPFNCSFCYNERYRKLYNVTSRNIRRSCRNAIEEIKLLKTKYKKTRIIKFPDDIFTLDRKWLFEFLDMYKKEINLEFVCHIRAGIDNEEVIEKLSQAGCRCVMFGVETGNENLRYQILNKKVSNQQISDTSHLLKKYKIKIYASNILFIPNATIDDVWSTVKINQKIGTHYPVVTIFQPYPGTRLNEELNKNNLLKINYLDNIKNFGSPPAVICKQRQVEKNIYYLFYILVRFPWLNPFLKQLVKCKPNILFLLIFKLTVGVEYCLMYKLNFIQFVKMAYHNYDFK